MNLRRTAGVTGLLLAFLVLIAGCGGDVAAEDAPSSLPAGESGALAGRPPIGRPSLGADLVSQPQRLELPSINIDTDVVEIGWQQVTRNGQTVSEWEVADAAAGWHKNSALPGEGGNVVMSGHNNIRGAVFRKLYTLEAGDEAFVWVNGQRFTYEVEDVMILEEKFAPIEKRRENAQWIQPFDDDRLTLVSCWPEDDNTHRVVVVAKRIGDSVSASE